MKKSVALLALAATSLSSPATAAPLAPTGRWVVNFDAAQCVASRAYGEDQLFLKASPLGDVVQFGLMEPGRAGPPQQVAAQIDPAMGEPFRGNAVLWSTKTQQPQRVRLINLLAADFQRLSASPSLTLKIGDLRRTYAIPGMPELAKVMKECVDDLQQVWSAGGDGVAAKAQANLATYFSDNDYPEDSIRNEVSGTTAFVLLIDEEGRVADCMVTQTSGQAALDTQSCAIVKRRARFTPARDAAGKPSKDVATSRIIWRIP